MTGRWPMLLLAFLAAVVAYGQEPTPAAAPVVSPAAQQQNLPNRELIVDGKPLGRAVEPRPSDICIVCKKPLGTKGVVYLVDGQRVPLHFAACYNAFEENPQKYLAVMQPHGAFLGTGGNKTGLSFAWFLGGLYVLVGLVFAALCAHRAVSIGRSPVGWFAAGLLLNAFAYLILLTRSRAIDTPVPSEGFGKVATTHSPIPCPQCGAGNHPAADSCIDCGSKLQSTVTSEVGKARLRIS